MTPENSDPTIGGAAVRVDSTGFALVHEGELILPASGTEAEASVVVSDDRSMIHYYFPVEIEVHSHGQTIDVDAVVDATLERLAASLASV